ncbi:FAD-binding and (Fe-S)-binding domain-containing protein [Gynuella sunshinyii]|uniref:D-lactate dehydrogenase (cytochrome) n=1 Tax=Gynuella sunshinyii YC6258 TaxID=1445510 RepID=A0A0C5VZT3_9GAMM|nr:FAD-binding and (Fe-S)-binding domain-containing protein [Gynuella sunshinyii]AJQ95939.1 FAD/FMN-containing dehydrogenase [Gynuella sunshinyii YC6258]
MESSSSQAWSQFLSVVRQHFKPENIIQEYTYRYAYSTDASFYRLIPELILIAVSEQQVITVLQAATELSVAITFRAAGTSLSGQAVSNSVLLMLDQSWNRIQVDLQGQIVHLQPGVIGADANRKLKPFGRKIGPDPASIDSCKIGGIVANNSSGMCCGTAHNTYHTLHGIRVILADGTLLDTRDSNSVETFRVSHAKLLAELSTLSEQVRQNPELKARIEHKYRLKNTTGYSINALVDFKDPVDILTHLIVGSEGTLGFISEVSYHTVPDHANKASALVIFSDIEAACNAVLASKALPVDAMELMDNRSLKAVADKPGLSRLGFQLDLENDECCALLIDIRGADAQTLKQNIEQVSSVLSGFELLAEAVFSQDADIISTYWDIRKGLFPAVGAVRPAGTTVIIEDVAFPLERLEQGVHALQQLFDQYHYNEAIIFGHALAGNLHFVFTQSFETTKEINRYERFMADVCQLVAVDYQGSLKAEHGTGRNMAPFVELEWGKDAYAIMTQIKHIFDPAGVLNPGVILNDDPSAHVQSLKKMPAVDILVDRCIECGFCEPVCPSRNLTLTPRQRITLYRHIGELKANGQTQRLAEVSRAYQYAGIDTCAATGLCAQKCPVSINTGDFIRKLRQQQNRRWKPVAVMVADHFTAAAAVTRGVLKIAEVGSRMVGEESLEKISSSVHRMSGSRTPLWVREMPSARKTAKLTSPPEIMSARQEFVYWPSCISRNLSPSRHDSLLPLPELILKLCEQAEINVRVLSDPGLCCGQPFESKGFLEVAEQKRQQTYRQLMEISDNGKIPILVDTSPCALKYFDQTEFRLYEPFEFALEYLVPILPIQPLDRKVALHVTCSTRRMGLLNAAVDLAQRCAAEVCVPEGIECCGFAGDKGFVVPELNQTALADLKRQIKGCVEGYSTSMTCECGLTRHAGISYRSILYLLAAAVR